MDVNKHLESARAFERQGKYAEACSEYEKAAEADPDCAEAWMNWGGALVMSGMHNKAPYKFKMFMKLIKKANIEPPDTGIVTKEMLVCAFESLRTFAIVPLDIVSYFMWGIALCMYGRYKEAEEKFHRAVELMLGYADAYYTWGLALAARGMHEDAIKKLQKAVEINPEYAEAYYVWGLILEKLGRDEEAAEKYRQASEVDPECMDFMKE